MAVGWTIIGFYMAGLVAAWWPLWRTMQGPSIRTRRWRATMGAVVTLLAVLWPLTAIPLLSRRWWTGRW